MQRAILLDIDGVVVPNCPLVNRSVERYVARKCRIPLKQARIVNRRLYKEYGHSHTGLCQVYGLSHSLEEFNAEVYDDLPRLNYWLDSLCQERCSNVTAAVQQFQRMQCNIFTFSNAPSEWCQQMLTKMKLQDIVQVLNITPYLKPQPTAYLQAMSELQKAGQSNCQIHFIDDSIQNLLVDPIADNPFWTCYLFSDNHHHLAFRNERFHCIDRLSNVLARLHQ